MRFRSFTHPKLPNMEAWKCNRGFWSFLILRDKIEDGYFTSYRDMRTPLADKITVASSQSVLFCDTHEQAHLAHAPIEWGYQSVDDAMRGCERKYKELILR